MNHEHRHFIYIVMASSSIIFLLDYQSQIVPVGIKIIIAFIASFGVCYYLRDIFTAPIEPKSELI